MNFIKFAIREILMITAICLLPFVALFGVTIPLTVGAFFDIPYPYEGILLTICIVSNLLLLIYLVYKEEN